MSVQPDSFAIDLDDVRQARRRIAPYVLRTPSLPCERLSLQLNCQLAFKAENLQHAGAFKSRGACNAVFALDDERASRGVVTHSSGNHAAAVARAARLRGIAAHVVMPHNSLQSKIAAVRSYGVEPVFCEPTAPARAAMAEEVQRRTGATMIHPYDDPRVMAGQGTVGWEILEQIEDVECIVVPVGGGGQLSGVLIAVKSLRPEVQVIAAEPRLADDAFRSLQSGSIEMPSRYDTIADGLRTPLGEHTFPVIRALVDDLILVEEETIVRAMRMLAEDAKLVAEPSGAVSLAAIVERSERFAQRKVVAVVSGGNVDTSGGAL